MSMPAPPGPDSPTPPPGPPRRKSIPWTWRLRLLLVPERIDGFLQGFATVFISVGLLCMTAGAVGLLAAH